LDARELEKNTQEPQRLGCLKRTHKKHNVLEVAREANTKKQPRSWMLLKKERMLTTCTSCNLGLVVQNEMK
jgi:hypothetical protein